MTEIRCHVHGHIGNCPTDVIVVLLGPCTKKRSSKNADALNRMIALKKVPFVCSVIQTLDNS